MNVNLFLFLVVVFTSSGDICRAQGSVEVSQPDTLELEERGSADAGGLEDASFIMTKDPVVAILWGVIPGGGQLYTEQYWKIPLFVLPIAGLTGLAIHNESKRKEFDRQAESASLGSAEYSTAIAQRQTYQDRRDLSIAIAGGVWILSLVDAYVGAHLYDFDVGDSLASGTIYLDPASTRVGVALTW